MSVAAHTVPEATSVRPLRVAMVGACPFPVPQGSQVFLADTARQVASMGHETHLVVYGYGCGDAPSDLRVHRCARVPGQGRTLAGPAWAKPLLDTAMVSALKRVVRNHGIDVVHAHNYEGLLVALAVGKRPIVYHAHNAMADELPHYFRRGFPAARFGCWLDRTFPKLADVCITPHVQLAEYLVSCGCERESVQVIPPAVDVEEFANVTVPVEQPTVLYAGNLDRYQNLGLLAEAMERVRRAVPDARLAVATADPRPFPADEHIAAPDFAALRDALARDCVVACPRTSWSGFPIKLLNAMAAGRAVVACAGAAHPVRHGVTGLVAPNGDATAFADGLIQLLRDASARARLGAAARESAKRDYSPAVCMQRLGVVYDGLIIGGERIR